MGTKRTRAVLRQGFLRNSVHPRVSTEGTCRSTAASIRGTKRKKPGGSSKSAQALLPRFSRQCWRLKLEKVSKDYSGAAGLSTCSRQFFERAPSWGRPLDFQCMDAPRSCHRSTRLSMRERLTLAYQACQEIFRSGQPHHDRRQHVSQRFDPVVEVIK